MDLPKHYSLVKEHDKHFEIHDKRDNKTFPIVKKDLHPAHQIKVMKMQKFDDGGGVKSTDVEGFDSGIKTKDESTDPYDKRSWLDSVIGTEDDMGQAPAPSHFDTNGMKLPAAPSGPEQYVPPQDNVQSQPTEVIPPTVAAPTPVTQPVPIGQGQSPQISMGGATTGGLNQIEGQEARGINMQAQGQIEQNKQFAEAQRQETDRQVMAQQKYEEKMNAHQEELDQLSHDVASTKIDPDHYWNSKSTGSKISTALGVLVAGIGQGLSHSTQNVAWSALQSNIDKDIDAQKSNLGKKQTLLSDNLRIQGNLMQAEAASRLQYSAIMQGQLAKIAAQTGDPMITGRAQQQIAELKLRDVPLKQQLAQHEVQMQMRNELMKGGGTKDPASYVPYVVPEQQQKAVFEEIKNAQDVKHLTPEILKAFDTASSRNPVIAAQGQKAFEGLINTTVKEQEGTARQAAFDSIHRSMTPSGITAMPGENASKRDTVMKYLGSKASAPVAKGFGIDLSKFESTSPSLTQEERLMNYAKAHPNDPNSATILRKLGTR